MKASIFSLVSYRRLSNVTVTMSGRDCLPPYAVIDSWHRLGNITGPRCYIQFAVRAEPVLPLLPIWKCEKKEKKRKKNEKTISVGLGVKISFVAFRQLYKL